MQVETEVQPETTEAPATEAEAQEGEGQDTEAQEGAEQEAEVPEEEAPKEGEESEGGEEEKPAQEVAAVETPEQKHKRAGGYQRKIERLERERQILLEQLQRSQPHQPPVPAKEKTPAEQTREYISTMVRQEAEALRAQEREAARQAEFRQRLSTARDAHPDFDEAMEMAAHIPVSDALGQALLTSEEPGEIMYRLAKNPAELARISALPPLDAAREIGRLEAKSASGATPPKPRTATRPPAPPSKVGGSASSTRSLEDLPLSEYKRAYRSGRR